MWWTIFFKFDMQYSGNLHKLHNYYSFLPEKMKIEKFKKLVANLLDKT